ncbi:MAG: alkanesulfonate monooxygenase SsuD [Gammaproteobacteria bacterium]|jgi:alkanesulfonate monooxygenase SsuD/methylene tetrahydromethanopterin reductase-like flavin-dependent oxidoreductase (luciferase family)
MAKPKVIVQIYPMLPAEDRADRERKRPLGRNREVYNQVLHETLDVVRELDQMGVWGISTIEHHMHSEGYEVGPDPGVLNAWWASQVKNAYVGALGYVMATRDPIRVAEETAILDHMTQGRLFVGLTRGYQSRWMSTLGQHVDAVATVSDGSDNDLKNRKIFEERVKMLIDCWTQESVSIDQPHYQIPYPHDTGVVGYPARDSIYTAGAHGEIDADGNLQRLCVVPSPYTRPHPPIFMPMSGSAASIPFMAKNGFRPVYFTPLKALVGFANLYVDEGKKAGIDYALGERQVIARWIHLGDKKQFRQRVRDYDQEMYYHHYSTFFEGMARPDTVEENVDAMLDSGIFMGGTVAELKDQWHKIYEELPVEYITLIWHYAQCPKEVMLEELGVFMNEVLPELDAPSSDGVVIQGMALS